MNDKVKSIVFKAALGFFAVVFILGFFSQSVINMFLPKVQAVAPTGGLIERTIEMEGVIEPKEILKVRLGEDVIVEEFFVQKGDKVIAGAPIFRINSNYRGVGIQGDIKDLKISLEKELSRLQKLNGSSFISDETNIEGLVEEINKEKENIARLEKLYETGAISLLELEESKNNLNSLTRSLEVSQELLLNKKNDASLEVKEVLSNIETLKKEIEVKEKRQDFYANIGEDGIYYSEVEGIVYTLNEPELILRQDTPIAEIAIVKDYTSLKYVTYLPEEEYSAIEDGGYIKAIYDISDKPLEIFITRVSKLLEDNMIMVEGDIAYESKKLPLIGDKLTGTFSTKTLGVFNVPKAGIVPIEGFKAGTEAYVYVLEEKDGILGTEYQAVKVRTRITAIGTNRISIDNLGGIENPKVITNLSYKIRDGARVFLWQ